MCTRGFDSLFLLSKRSLTDFSFSFGGNMKVTLYVKEFELSLKEFALLHLIFDDAPYREEGGVYLETQYDFVHSEGLKAETPEYWFEYLVSNNCDYYDDADLILLQRLGLVVEDLNGDLFLTDTGNRIYCRYLKYYKRLGEARVVTRGIIEAEVISA